MESNVGSVASSYNYVGYYLSTDSVYSVGDTYLTSSYVSSLSAGYTTSLSPSISLPSTLTTGTYYLIAVADYSSYVSESNENNNSKALRINVTAPLIDLKVSSFTLTSTSVTAGTYVYPSVIESNVGNSASSYNYVGYYLSTDSVYSVGDTYLTSSYVSSLSAGYTTSLSPSISLPSTLTTGTYYLIAVADYSSYVSESNENNNSKALRINVIAPLIDLTVSSFTATSNNVTAASYFYPTVSIYNTGNTSASTIYTYYYLSTDSTYSVGDTYLTYSYSSSLSAGNSVSYAPSLYIPSGISVGTYYIVAYVDYGSYNTETNENNNFKPYRINVITPNVDLKISSFTSTTNITSAGYYFYPSVSMSNSGTTASGSSSIGYYLSSDSTYNVGDTYLTYSSSSSLAAGSFTTFSPSIYIPSTTPTGNYYIIAVADYSGSVTETNENNNTKSLKISVQVAGSDLVVTNFSATSTNVAYGNYFYPSVVVKNQGSTYTSNYSYVGYYLSTDSVYSIGDTQLSYSSSVYLSAGSSTSLSPSLYLSSSITPGTYYIIAVADYNNYETEINENNNTKSLRITVTAPVVDIVPTSFIPQNTSVTSGQYFYPYLTVANNGNTSASTYVYYYLSTDSTYSIGDTQLNYYSISVSANSTVLNTPSLYIPSSTANGTYYIIAVCDYGNYVTETNENNNSKALKINVVSPNIDLAISSFALSSSNVSAGNYIYPTGSEINLGSTGTSSYNYVGFYLSSDSIISIGDTYLTYSSISSITSGGSASFAPSVYISSTTPTGAYYLIAVADYSGTIFETNENNNSKAIRINVVTPFVDLVIKKLSMPSSISAGNYYYPKTVEYNIGTSYPGAYTYTGYYLSTDTVLNTSVDTYLGSESEYHYANDSVTSSVSLYIPSTITNGTYYIIAKADYSGYATETNENNNTKWVRVSCVNPTTDYYIKSFTLPTTNILSGGTYVYPTVVEGNNGSVTSTSSYHYVGFYLSSDSVYSSDDTYLSYSYGNYSDASDYTISPSLYISSTVLPGQYYLLAIADYNGNVAETNENNNKKALKINIATSFVDYIIGSISAPTGTFTTGSILQLSSVVKNIGNTSASYNTNTAFVLSSDSVYSSNDVYLNNISTTYLGAGGTTNVNSSVAIPSSLAAGTYYILSVADYFNVLTESNESNNAKSSKVKITIVTDVTDVTLENNVSVYPNPSSGVVKISNSLNSTLNVFDMNGTLVHSQNVSQEKIDLSNLDSGVYMINLNSDSNLIHSEKLVITK
ncbi:MAG: CARDB domain-containing protein [Cytophagales bacterium]